MNVPCPMGSICIAVGPTRCGVHSEGCNMFVVHIMLCGTWGWYEGIYMVCMKGCRWMAEDSVICTPTTRLLLKDGLFGGDVVFWFMGFHEHFSHECRHFHSSRP
jgi:hypothetical protein